MVLYCIHPCLLTAELLFNLQGPDPLSPPPQGLLLNAEPPLSLMITVLLHAAHRSHGGSSCTSRCLTPSKSSLKVCRMAASSLRLHFFLLSRMLQKHQSRTGRFQAGYVSVIFVAVGGRKITTAHFPSLLSHRNKASLCLG